MRVSPLTFPAGADINTRRQTRTCCDARSPSRGRSLYGVWMRHDEASEGHSTAQLGIAVSSISNRVVFSQLFPNPLAKILKTK
jgi:hypothetical protein